MLLLDGGCGGEEESQSSANPRGSLLGRGEGDRGGLCRLAESKTRAESNEMETV